MEFVTGALSALIPKLGQLLTDEYKLQRSAKENVQFLLKELESMRVALRKVGDVPPEQLDEQVRIWAREVRELSYDMEDIVDTFLVRVQSPETPSKKNSKRFIKKMTSMVTKATTRRDIAQEIKEMKDRVKEAAERRDRYKVEIINPPRSLVDPRITALYTKASDLVGIDEAREELITRLTRGDGLFARQPRIVSIVGFGGVGKTTLAKAVYDKLRVQFDCAAFVSVSRNPDTKKVLKDMLYELDRGLYGNIHSAMLDELKHLIDLVREFLQNKRYLVVIDDIWDIAPWQIIRCALSENNKTSRIVITTRIIGVAEQVGHCYKLKPLAHENSKKLFYGRVFGSEVKCPNQFSEVSENFLKKCGGVPLAIITTSSLLANKLGNIREWYQLCDSIGYGVGSNPIMDNMRKIILLSYYDLPPHLKTCLLYLSTFPEDYTIGRDRLILRWIAEDFVQHGDGGQSLFELGKSYFNELLNRSLIQPASMDSQGNPWACRVHDMVLDFICSLSMEERFVTTVLGDTEQKKTYLGSNVRRLSLHNSTWPKMKMSKLRSLTFSSSATINSVPSLSSYHLLRVLDLEDCNLRYHLNLRFLGNLFHLRYLGLSDTGYAGELPVDIGRLQFLQTLQLHGTDIEELPLSIAGLRQLMCLYVDESITLPDGLRNLTSLEVLALAGVNSVHIAEELGHLTQLRVLGVHLRKDVEGETEEKMGKVLVELLGKLHKIEYLVIKSEVMVDLKGSVESLSNMCRLYIERTNVLPTWINPASLPLLSYLHITLDQVRREDIQVLGMLLALHYLEVEVTGDTQGNKRFMVSLDSFPCATHCNFVGFDTVPSMFPPGAMPRLEQFKFRIRLDDLCNGEITVGDLALGHLPSLRSVRVCVDGGDKVSEEGLKKVQEVMRHESDVHPNHPSIHIYT